jgi:hypothetical protein
MHLPSRSVMLAVIACLAVLSFLMSVYRAEGAKPKKNDDDKKKKKKNDDKKKKKTTTTTSKTSCGNSIAGTNYETGMRQFGTGSNAGLEPPLDPAKCKGIVASRKKVCYVSDGKKWSYVDDKDKDCKDAHPWMSLVNWKDPALRTKIKSKLDVKGYQKYEKKRPGNQDLFGNNDREYNVKTPADCATKCKELGDQCQGFTWNNKKRSDNLYRCMPVKSLAYGFQKDGAATDGAFIDDDQWTTFAKKGYTILGAGYGGGGGGGCVAGNSGGNVIKDKVVTIQNSDGANFLTFQDTEYRVTNIATIDTNSKWKITDVPNEGGMFVTIQNQTGKDGQSYLQPDWAKNPNGQCADGMTLRVGQNTSDGQSHWKVSNGSNGTFKFSNRKCDGKSASYLWMGAGYGAMLTTAAKAGEFKIAEAT